ncbi:hypothetical protein HRbin30_01096 [bacterium HR30]|nr:hypothetical protein HRbin30_01096 [bacterium HR30]
MGALFADFAAVQDKDAVSALHGRQPVSDHDHGAPADEGLNGIFDQCFGLGIDSRGRFIQNENSRILRKCPRVGQKLPLPRRQVGAPLTHQLFESPREFANKRVGMYGASKVFELLPRKLRLPQCNVFRHGA